MEEGHEMSAAPGLLYVATHAGHSSLRRRGLSYRRLMDARGVMPRSFSHPHLAIPLPTRVWICPVPKATARPTAVMRGAQAVPHPRASRGARRPKFESIARVRSRAARIRANQA